MAVEGGAADAEDLGDLVERFLALVVELLGVGDLFGCEFGGASALAASGTGGGESGAGSGADGAAVQAVEPG
nr:hypothetical protein [Nocardia africana]